MVNGHPWKLLPLLAAAPVEALLQPTNPEMRRNSIGTVDGSAANSALPASTAARFLKAPAGIAAHKSPSGANLTGADELTRFPYLFRSRAKE